MDKSLLSCELQGKRSETISLLNGIDYSQPQLILSECNIRKMADVMLLIGNISIAVRKIICACFDVRCKFKNYLHINKIIKFSKLPFNTFELIQDTGASCQKEEYNHIVNFASGLQSSSSNHKNEASRIIEGDIWNTAVNSNIIASAGIRLGSN